ncbi:MAG: hypothetical protein CVT87_02145 [Alphaproteobacteria bacterium HGW-Alphaproteobacteria-9]|nr:MAG: hypothetical protein CVT87_02145 [Alphaproteobacteria bacterium HGW-Alphaproteobacteria-9]
MQDGKGAGSWARITAGQPALSSAAALRTDYFAPLLKRIDGHAAQSPRRNRRYHTIVALHATKLGVFAFEFDAIEHHLKP